MKITKTQLKQIIKEELGRALKQEAFGKRESRPVEPGLERDTFRSVNIPQSAWGPGDWRTKIPPAEEVGEQVKSLPADALAKVWELIGDFILPDAGSSYRDSLSPEEIEDAGLGNPRLSEESINRDKLATLVAEEVRKILKNK